MQKLLKVYRDLFCDIVVGDLIQLNPQAKLYYKHNNNIQVAKSATVISISHGSSIKLTVDKPLITNQLTYNLYRIEKI